MPTTSNHTEVSAHCYHGKHMVASSQTLLSNFQYYKDDEKFRYVYTSNFFRKLAHTEYDVPWFVELTDSTYFIVMLYKGLQ
jgi:hypothetical protein